MEDLNLSTTNMLECNVRYSVSKDKWSVHVVGLLHQSRISATVVMPVN